MLTPAQLASYAAAAGFRGMALAVAVAVALAESGGDPGARNASSGAAGLWQVLPAAHPEYAPATLLDPAYNARAAYAISSQGTDWTPWTTYTNGRYQAFLGTAQAAASAPAQTPGVTVQTAQAGAPIGGLLLLGAALLALVW